MTVATESDRLFPLLLARCRELSARFGRAQEVPLSIYETDDDLATLRPEDGGRWTADFHRQVMESLALRLRLEGFPVRLVLLNAADYLRWLAQEKRRNSPEARAQFISLQR